MLYESQNDQPYSLAVCQSGPFCISLSVQSDKSGIANLSLNFVMYVIVEEGKEITQHAQQCM